MVKNKSYLFEGYFFLFYHKRNLLRSKSLNNLTKVTNMIKKEKIDLIDLIHMKLLVEPDVRFYQLTANYLISTCALFNNKRRTESNLQAF